MSLEAIKHSLLEFRKTRDFQAFFARSLQNKADLDDLLHVSLDYSDEIPCILGSWVCTHWIEKDKKMFQKALPEIINFLESSQHQSSLRSFMKILSELEIEEDYQGRALDLCTQFISDSNNKVALQVYSMYVLIPLMQIYPELYPEINALIELHSINKTPAYHAAFRNFRKRTKKISTI